MITNCQLEMTPTHQFSNDVLFSFRIKMTWCFVLLLHGVLIYALRESGETGYVGDSDSVVQLYILNQAIQTDNGKFYVAIKLSNFHCFEWFIQTSSSLAFGFCHSLTYISYLQLSENRDDEKSHRAYLKCTELQFRLALPNKCLSACSCACICIFERYFLYTFFFFFVWLRKKDQLTAMTVV